MRNCLIVFLFFVAACRPQPEPIGFDGAQATQPARVRAHGERLTHVLGCTGCHGANLEGTLFTKDHPQYGPLYASNLTVEVAEYSDAQLDGIIRQGVHPERKSVWGMPSQVFHNLSDADLTALIAYLRTLKPMGKKMPPPQFSAQDKKDIAAGVYGPSSELVRKLDGVLPADLGRQYMLGRYITEVTCTECHGPKLEGESTSKTPNLIVAGGYSRAEFDRLITRGIPPGGRKLNPMMSGVATTRFSHMSLHERDALYSYLKARADRPTP
jgi:cytochrome c553